MKLRILFLTTAVLSFAALAPQARTAQTTGSLTVTATVKSNCTISGGTLAFGDYVSGQTASVDTVGSIQVTNCPSSAVTMELNGGANNSVTDRRMSSGANQLKYQIFKDSARTQNWATGVDAVNVTTPATSPYSVNVYGRITGSQAVQPGNYTDTVTVTMTF